MVTSGSCLDATVLTGRLTGAAAACMVSWMVPADATCWLGCALCKLSGLNGVVAVYVAFSVTALIQTMLYGW